MYSTIAPCGNHKLAEPLYGRMKRIQVFENGEQRCYLLNIVPRNFRSWNAVLQHITNVIRPNFGPVKRLVALRTCRCIETFEELDSCEKYIALGLNGCLKMVPGGYRDNCRQKGCCKQLYCGQLDSQMSCFLRETKKKGLTIIYVVRNGICIQVPKKIVLRKHDLQSWDLILRFLSKKLDIPEGAAFICTIFGEMLCDPRELQHGYVYVVIPYQEDFVKLDYLQCFQYLCCLYRRNYVVDIKPAACKRNKKCRCRKKIESCSICDKIDHVNEPEVPCTCPRNPYLTRGSTNENICGCLNDISSSADIVIFQNDDFKENGLPCCFEEDSYDDTNVKETIFFYEPQSYNSCCPVQSKPLLISDEAKDKELCQCFTCQSRKILQDLTRDAQISLNSDREGNIEKTSVEDCFYKRSKSKTLCCQKEPNDNNTTPLSCCQSYCCIGSTGTSDADGSGYEPNPNENKERPKELCQCFTCQSRKILQDVECDAQIGLNSDRGGNNEKALLEECFYKQMLGKSKSKTLCCQKNQEEPNDNNTRPLSCCKSYCCVGSTGTSDPGGSGYERNANDEDKKRPKELCDFSTCQDKANRKIELTCDDHIGSSSDRDGTVTENLVEGCFYKQMLGISKSKSICCPKNRNEPNDYNSRPLSCCRSYCCVGRTETGNSDGSGRQGNCSSKNNEVADVDENISCLNNNSSGKLDSSDNNKKPEYIKDYCTLMNILREYSQLHTKGKKKFRSKTCSVCKRSSDKNYRTEKMKSCPNLIRRKICNKGKMPVKTIPSMFIEPTPDPRINCCNTLTPMPPCCFYGLSYCQNRFCQNS